MQIVARTIYRMRQKTTQHNMNTFNIENETNDKQMGLDVRGF